MSFRIAIPKPPRLQRQPIRTHQRPPIVHPVSQSRQMQHLVQASETSNPRAPWIEYLKAHGDLKDMRVHGRLLRKSCALVSQSAEEPGYRIQALIVASTMAALFPFTSFVMLLDSSVYLLKDAQHPKLSPLGLYSGALIILSIFPITALVTSTLTGLIIIFEDELRTLPRHVHEKYALVNSFTQHVGIEEKYSKWTEELYTELVSPSTPDASKPLLESVPDIELGTSIFVNISSASNERSSTKPASTHPAQVDVNSTPSLENTADAPDPAPFLPSISPLKFEPITFPKVIIQPPPAPQKTFDAEGWLIIPSPFDDSNQCKHEQASNGEI